jgi:hypothetical protein
MRDFKRISMRFDMAKGIDREVFAWIHEMAESRSISLNAFILLTLNKVRTAAQGPDLLSGRESDAGGTAEDRTQETELTPIVPEEAMEFIESIGM